MHAKHKPVKRKIWRANFRVQHICWAFLQWASDLGSTIFDFDVDFICCQPRDLIYMQIKSLLIWFGLGQCYYKSSLNHIYKAYTIETINLLKIKHNDTQIYSWNMPYRLRPNVAHMLEHLLPHDASSHFTSCVFHVVLPKASNQRNNNFFKTKIQTSTIGPTSCVRSVITWWTNFFTMFWFLGTQSCNRLMYHLKVASLKVLDRSLHLGNMKLQGFPYACWWGRHGCTYRYFNQISWVMMSWNFQV